MDEAHREIWKAIEEIKEFNGEEAYRNAKDRGTIAELVIYITEKDSNKRKDYTYLSVKLWKEVMRRPRGMTTRDIKNFLGLEHTQQALRLMERVAKDYLIDITLQKGKGKNKGWKLKARASTGLI